MDENELIGFNLIGDMTREQMIAEILAGQRMLLEGTDTDNLIENVILTRVHHYKMRLMKEAKPNADND